MRALLGLVIIVFSVAAAAQADSYLCVADKSTGFQFNKSTKTWESVNFNVDDSKYIVRPTTPDDKVLWPGRYAYGVWKLGENTPMILCKEGISKADWLSRGAEYQRFVLNARTNRYMHTYVGEYMVATFENVRDDHGMPVIIDGEWVSRDKEDEGGDTPYMEIGKCSSL